jgi:hypothetical protein
MTPVSTTSTDLLDTNDPERRKCKRSVDLISKAAPREFVPFYEMIYQSGMTPAPPTVMAWRPLGKGFHSRNFSFL